MNDDINSLDVYTECENMMPEYEDALEKEMNNQGYTVKREQDTFSIQLDPKFEYMPSCPSEKRIKEKLEIIANRAVFPGEEERIIFGFNNSGNLNIEKDWIGTPEKFGEELMQCAIYEEYDEIISSMKSKVKAIVNDFITLFKEQSS